MANTSEMLCLCALQLHNKLQPAISVHARDVLDMTITQAFVETVLATAHAFRLDMAAAEQTAAEKHNRHVAALALRDTQHARVALVNRLGVDVRCVVSGSRSGDGEELFELKSGDTRLLGTRIRLVRACAAGRHRERAVTLVCARHAQICRRWLSWSTGAWRTTAARLTAFALRPLCLRLP